MQIPSYISTRLHYQHKSIIDQIEPFSDEQIRRSVIPGKWSIFENIVHLQTYQHTFTERVQQILEGNNPLFSRYTAEADPLFQENCTKSSREIFQDLLTTRKEMVARFHAIPPEDLVKTGQHPAYGQMNLLQWISFFLLHEGHHLYTIFRLTAELKKQ